MIPIFNKKAFIVLFLFFLISVPALSFSKTKKIVLIKFKNQKASERFLKEHKNSQKTKIENLVEIRDPSFFEEQWLKLSSKFDSNIEYVESGEPIKKALVPNDSGYSNQWGLSKIYASKAWNISTGSSSNIIAIVDTGVQLNHPDLVNKIWVNESEYNGTEGVDDDSNGFVDDIYGWDFGDSDNNPSDSDGHGTLVSGVAGAETNNNQGIAGVDWQAKIMAVKVWKNGENEASPTDAALGVQYAADNGAKVINMSWGSFTDWSVIRDAIEYAYSKGCILVGATGNDGSLTQVYYPAKYSQVIGVGAINSSSNLTSYTNRGTGLDLAAPGDSIYSTYKGSTYAYASGTSLAAPFVSGAVSLLLSDEPNLTNAQVMSKIKELTNSVSNYNLGYINLFKVLKIRLVKSGSSATYLIDGANKFSLFNSNTFWQRFGFSSSFVENVSSSVLNSFTNQGSLTGLWKTQGNSQVYFIDLKSRYSVWPSNAFWSRWDFHNSDVRTVSSDLMELFPYVGRLTALVKGNSSSQVYFVDEGKRYPVWSSEEFYRRWGFSSSDVVVISQSQVNNMQTGRWLTGLIRGKTLPMVYLIDEAKAKPIMSEGIFYHWGWKDSEITWLSDSFILNMPKKSFVTRLASDGNDYYWINEGLKRKINNSHLVFSNHDWSFNDVGSISYDFLTAFPSGEDLNF